MKILKWMQGKLYPANGYSLVSPKMSPKAFEKDTGKLTTAAPPPDAEAPLLWYAMECTILSIGTLGHPHLFPHFPEKEPNLEPPQLDPPAQPKPDSGPLAPTRPRPKRELLEIKFSGNAPGAAAPAAEEKKMAEPLLKGDGERKERTTLAELFAADQASPAKCSPPLKITGGDQKKNNNKKNKEDKLNSLQSSASAKRLHRMIMALVKNKIHPEVDTLSGQKGDRATEPLLHKGHGGRNGG